MKQFELGGLIAAPFTPFTKEGELNLGVVEKLAERLVATGVKGAFVCGTTGEGLSMSTDQRMKVAGRWAEVCHGGPLKLIVHVGHNSQADAVALARHAQSIGADAVSALPPFFFKPAKVEHAVGFVRPIAAAAPALPFYYYHIPSMTGVTLPMNELLQPASAIPNFRGIKFTHGDLMEFERCKRFENGRFEIAWGIDEMLLGALSFSATSAVGSTYNYAAPNYARMIAAFKAGDVAAARQCAARAVDLVAILLRFGGLRTGKAIMALSGIDCGPTMSPVPPAAGDEITSIRKSLEEIGYFDWKN